jgi:hypothetical protein
MATRAPCLANSFAMAAPIPRELPVTLERTVELPWRGGTKSFRGDRFLTEFALPNFFSHLTLAYAIVHRHGVPLEKIDFMGD